MRVTAVGMVWQARENSSTLGPHRNQGRDCSPDTRLHRLGKLGTSSLTENWLPATTSRASLCVHSGRSVLTFTQSCAYFHRKPRTVLGFQIYKCVLDPRVVLQLGICSHETVFGMYEQSLVCPFGLHHFYLLDAWVTLHSCLP